jgi:hypothetical protein
MNLILAGQLQAIEDIEFKKKLAKVREAMEKRAQDRRTNREGN